MKFHGVRVQELNPVDFYLQITQLAMVSVQLNICSANSASSATARAGKSNFKKTKCLTSCHHGHLVILNFNKLN